MPATRRYKKQGRWAAETRAREMPLDEVPETVHRISIPEDMTPETQRAVNPEEARLAVELQGLRRELDRGRWIPWRRRKRRAIQAKIEELKAQRVQLRRQRLGGRL